MVAPLVAALIAAGVSAAVGVGTTLVVNALTPAQKVQTGKLDDLSVPKSSYGAVIPQCWGNLKLAGIMLWSTPKREVTETKKTGGKGGPKVKTETTTYFASFAVMFAYCPNRSAEALNRIWLNGKLVFDALSTEPSVISASAEFLANHVRFYTGAHDQPVDPLLQNIPPIQSYDYGLPHSLAERAAALQQLGLPDDLNHIPAYRYKCYVVFENLSLTDYNSQLPIVKAEILFNSNNTLETIVTDICNQSGITNFDTTGIANIPVPGYYLDTVTEAVEAFRTLQQAYFFDIIKSGDTLLFVPESALRPITFIPTQDLGSVAGGGKRPSPFELPKPDPVSLPESVEVTFIDEEADFETGNVGSRSQVAGSKRKESYDFPLVMNSDRAQALADTLLHRLYLRSIELQSLSLPRKYCYLEPGDWIEIEVGSQVYQLQITMMQIGANLQVKIDAVVVEAASLNALTQGFTPISSGGYNLPIASSNFSFPQGATNLQIMDINLISDLDVDDGVYVAASGGSSWNNCSVYVSNDNVSYYFTGTTLNSGTIGTTVSPLDSTTISFSVQMSSGTLSSISDIDFNNKVNRILVGNEILQFQNATETYDNIFELSNLRRGLRGTESFIDSHTLGERVVLLSGDGALFERIGGNLQDLGQVRYFKAPSGGQSLDAAVAYSITIEGLALNPYSPVNLAATVDNVGNITVTWDRRDRHAGDATTYDNLPLSEQEEKWEIEVLDLNGAVIRTETLLSNIFVYTNSEQTDDFDDPQSSITVNIYQISATVGRGYVGNATLVPTLFQPDPVIDEIYPNPSVLGTTVTLLGSGFNTINEIFFSENFKAPDDEINIISDNKLTFKFVNPAFAGDTESLNFIINSSGFSHPSLINFFTDTKMSILPANEGGSGGEGGFSDYSGFVFITETRDITDADHGKILIIDTTNEELGVNLNVDNITTLNFFFTLIKVNFTNEFYSNRAVLYGTGYGTPLITENPNLDGSFDWRRVFLNVLSSGEYNWYAIGGNNGDYSGFLNVAENIDNNSGLISASRISQPIPASTQDFTFLPYILNYDDIGKEIVIQNGTGDLYIPTEAFYPNGWGCIVTSQIDGNIKIGRQDGSTTGLIFSGGSTNQYLRGQGTVAISHRGNDIWLIVGALST